MGVTGDTDQGRPQLLRRREVERRTALGTSTIYKLVREGQFPRAKRVPGAPGVVVWLESEVEAWLASLPDADPADRPARGRAAAVDTGIK